MAPPPDERTPAEREADAPYPHDIAGGTVPADLHPDETDGPPHAPRGRLARSTAIFSFATGLSRILGLFREILVRRYFGVSGPINTFTVAFVVPNLLRSLVADAALSASFVPVFSEMLEKREKLRAWRVASTIFWLVLLVLGGITALFILLAPGRTFFARVQLVALFALVFGLFGARFQDQLMALPDAEPHETAHDHRQRSRQRMPRAHRPSWQSRAAVTIHRCHDDPPFR